MRILACLALFVKTCETSMLCKTAESVYGRFLKQHVISTHSAAELLDCTLLCQKVGKCRSWNFWLDDKKCELNDGDNYNHPRDLKEKDRVIYSNAIVSAPNAKSCTDVKGGDPGAATGYYWINVKGKAARVFCDMDQHGGGWTLVASISSQNNDHLQRAEHNCFNSELCVPFANVTISARKFSDANIHEIVAEEGIFRVEDWTATPVNTVFYKIPSGASYFDSSCNFGSCPRIIISYSFPYVWESNCKGTELGYKIDGGCHSVFDGHDGGECGGANKWWSSQSRHGRRILYGYPARCNSKGLYHNRQGLLFVK